MRRKLLTNLFLTLMLAWMTGACAQSLPTPVATLPPPQVTIIHTQANSATITPQPSESPTQTLPTDTPVPTDMPVPTIMPSQTEPPCTNQAEFVKSLSISDNTQLNPGTQFTKMWQIKNVGTCSWTVDYQFVMVSGDSMQAPTSVPLPHEVLPQETIDIGIKMIAPDKPDTYSNDWVLMDSDGNYFGTGAQYDQPLVAKIVVPTIYKLKPT